MKLNHVPFSEVTETDTDKLADVDALIMEKAEELRSLCFSAKRQCFISVDACGMENGSSFAFWNLVMKTEDATTETGFVKALNNLLNSLNGSIFKLTNGKVGLRHL